MRSPEKQLDFFAESEVKIIGKPRTMISETGAGSCIFTVEINSEKHIIRIIRHTSGELFIPHAGKFTDSALEKLKEIARQEFREEKRKKDGLPFCKECQCYHSPQEPHSDWKL